MNEIEVSYWENVLGYIFTDSDEEEALDISANQTCSQNSRKVTDTRINLNLNVSDKNCLCTSRSLKHLASIGILQDIEPPFHNHSNIWSRSFKSNHLSLQSSLYRTVSKNIDFGYIYRAEDDDKENNLHPSSTISTFAGQNKQFTIPKGSRFFVIKSFNQQDVCSAYKHGIWASTDLGNKRLSRAFRELEVNGHIYLFFSVNSSGRFCGVAVMKNDIDFTKTSDIWSEKSRWKGIFPLEWIFIKDIPNRYFHHLKIISNENKPVTNSRDTQEVPYNIAMDMMKLFKSFKSKSNFLPDYENFQ